jgi:hypothetical protein
MTKIVNRRSAAMTRSASDGPITIRIVVKIAPNESNTKQTIATAVTS